MFHCRNKNNLSNFIDYVIQMLQTKKKQYLKEKKKHI